MLKLCQTTDRYNIHICQELSFPALKSFFFKLVGTFRAAPKSINKPLNLQELLVSLTK